MRSIKRKTNRLKVKRLAKLKKRLTRKVGTPRR